MECNIKELQNIDEYLIYFEKQFNGINKLKELKEIYPIFLSLCEEFKKTIISEELTFFEKVAKTLELDAKLQLIVSWFGDRNWQTIFNESEIIHFIEDDIGCYYRELTGISKNSPIPNAIIYLSEKNYSDFNMD